MFGNKPHQKNPNSKTGKLQLFYLSEHLCIKLPLCLIRYKTVRRFSIFAMIRLLKRAAKAKGEQKNIS